MATSLVKHQLLAVCFIHHCCSADALPTSPFLCNFASLEDCIRSYWSVGYKYTSIVIFLTTYHGIQIGLRQLKYLINVKYNLRRIKSQSTAHEIRRAIRYELNGPGCLMGYRAMTYMSNRSFSVTWPLYNWPPYWCTCKQWTRIAWALKKWFCVRFLAVEPEPFVIKEFIWQEFLQL